METNGTQPRDGILDPQDSETVSLPPELEALDRWAANPNDPAAFEAAMAALAPGGNPDDLATARTALVMAANEQTRESVRAQLREWMADQKPLPPAASFRAAAQISDPMPRPILAAAGMGGALLAEGAVCLLSGAGGTAKSTLAATLALDVAHGGELVNPDGMDGLAKGFSRLFDVRPGPVMIASYEDPAGVVTWRLRELAHARSAAAGVLERVHVAHMAGLPLYGPHSLYTARPEPLRGWAHLWAAADRIRPALVIVDPALGAYTGEANHLAAVREFMSALASEASARGCGVLVVAHSNKAARARDNDDPFDPGHVGGAGAWADADRGVLTLTGRSDDRTLAVAKANWGRAYVKTQLAPMANDAGALIGFNADPDGWTASTGAKTTTAN